MRHKRNLEKMANYFYFPYMPSKLAFIKKTLDTLYPNPAVPLKYTDAFSLLVAVCSLRNARIPL
jgi:hypothetical protein